MSDLARVLLRYIGATVIFIITFVLAGWLFDVLFRRRRYPPGPLPLPVIGNLHILGRRIDKSLHRIGSQYGDVFTVYFGATPVVVLNNYEMIKEAFLKQGNNFLGRPNFLMFKVTTNKFGIIMSDGDNWKLNRKVLQNVLRDFGFGKSSMEDKIQEECRMMIADFDQRKGDPFDLHFPLAKAVSNVTCSIIYGKRFDYKDETFNWLIETYDTGVKRIGEGAIVNFFPFLQYLPGDLFHMKYIAYTDIVSTRFNREKIQKSLQRDDRKKIDTFIDAYIDGMERQGESPDNSEHLKTHMAKTFNDFFGAGTETTTTTLRWCVVFLLHQPHYQTKVQEEIGHVIGQDTPRMSHMRDMPFTEALLCETLRMGNITPLGMFHETTKDVQIRGHDIPGGTVVVPNMTKVLMDPRVFPEPRRFYPERFLNAEGKVVKPDSFIPFSIGKRVCLGESLARMELFIFFTMLLQRYSFKLPDGHPLPSLDGQLSLTLTPLSFEVCLVRRQ